MRYYNRAGDQYFDSDQQYSHDELDQIFNQGAPAPHPGATAPIQTQPVPDPARAAPSDPGDPTEGGFFQSGQGGPPWYSPGPLAQGIANSAADFGTLAEDVTQSRRIPGMSGLDQTVRQFTQNQLGPDVAKDPDAWRRLSTLQKGEYYYGRALPYAWTSAVGGPEAQAAKAGGKLMEPVGRTVLSGPGIKKELAELARTKPGLRGGAKAAAERGAVTRGRAIGAARGRAVGQKVGGVAGRITGGATSGAVGGAAAEPESRERGAIIGGLTGGAFPAAGALARASAPIIGHAARWAGYAALPGASHIMWPALSFGPGGRLTHNFGHWVADRLGRIIGFVPGGAAGAAASAEFPPTQAPTGGATP